MMRGAILIAMREVRERRAVLAAALVAGLLPFASPLIPGVAAARAGEARDAMAAILALGLGVILSILLGATAVARDLAENRLGFDFARPIGALGIWAGRLGAAVGLTLAAIVIVATPASLIGGRISLPDRGETIGEIGLPVLGAVLLFVGLAHAASVAFRSRSRWLALDLVGLVVVLLLAASGVKRIHDAFAVETAWLVGTVAVVALIPALWIASALQVARGRTDLVRGHRTQSIALWSMLLVLALAIAGFSLWFVAADVDDLVAAWAEPAPAGPWIALDGTARGRPGLEAQFLLDTESGRSIRLAPGDLTSGNATMFTRDGRSAVWMHRMAGSNTIEVEVIDLAGPDPRPRMTSIAFDLLMPIRADLSPSGTRLATLQGRSLAVHDLEAGRILAAATLAETDQTWGRVRVTFVDENRVRVYVLGERLIAHELDVEHRASTSWTGPEVGEAYPALHWRAGHDRLILADPGPTGAVLLDGSSGATIRQLGALGAQSVTSCGFLDDGRIAMVAEPVWGRAALELLSTDGAPLASFDLGTTDPSTTFWLGAEAAPGMLLIGRSSRTEPGELPAGRLMLVDLSTGMVREVEGGGRPVAAMSWIDQQRPAQPASVAARLVQRARSVWLLDPASATLRLLAGRDEPS